MEERGLIDIGNLASWSVSSYKVGLGVEALCEDDPAKYWQSDGPQPHYIDIHFSKRVSVERLSIYTDFGLDRSRIHLQKSRFSLEQGTTRCRRLSQSIYMSQWAGAM